jgi:hypothetical protein
MSRGPFAVALSIAVLSCSPALSRAQFGISGGFAMPGGEFGAVAKTGYAFNAFVSLLPPAGATTVRLEAGLNGMKYKLDAPSASARVMSMTANAVIPVPGVKGPYAIAGAGVYRATAECSGCTTKSTKGGLNAGAGYAFPIGANQGFVEVRFHYIGGPNDPTNAGVSGASTRFIPVLVGFRF